MVSHSNLFRKGPVHGRSALLLAIRRSPDEPLEPKPAADLVVPAGSVLIALGSPDELEALVALAR